MTYNIRSNTANQELDIRGSKNKTSNMTLSDEPLGLGQAISNGSSASIVVGATVRVSGLVGMSSANKENYITISNAINAGNNGTFLISEVINATTVDIINAVATTDPNNGNIVWIHRKPYSLEDDLNYERTDRAAIKGVLYSDPIPVYSRCTDALTDIPANLDNIAGKTTDAKSIIVYKKIDSITVNTGDTFYLAVGSFPWAKTANRTGVPLYDGADAGNVDATHVDLGNLKVLSGINEGWSIYGRARHGISGVDGVSFEIEFRAFQGVNDIAYTWEANQEKTLYNVYYPFRYCLDGMPETELLRTTELPVPNSVGQVLIAVEPGKFVVAQPITSDQGWLVNIDGILLVNTH